MKCHPTGSYPEDWKLIARQVKEAARWHCIRCGQYNDQPSGYVLTVHHFDGRKDNCRWWNLLALCQRCHLRIQARVNPEQTYMFEHTAWLKPYVAGYYAYIYLDQELTRAQVMEQLEELLALERLV